MDVTCEAGRGTSRAAAVVSMLEGLADRAAFPRSLPLSIVDARGEPMTSNR